MTSRKTSLTNAKSGDAPTASEPSRLDTDDTSASTLIEAPVQPGSAKARKHDFPDGGGSGGAEAFRRKPRPRPRPPSA